MTATIHPLPVISPRATRAYRTRKPCRRPGSVPPPSPSSLRSSRTITELARALNALPASASQAAVDATMDAYLGGAS